jgi:hypothetical protein
MNFSQCRGIYTGDVRKVPQTWGRTRLGVAPSSCFECEVVVTACDTFHVRCVVCVEPRVCCRLFISVVMGDCTPSSMPLLIRSAGGFGNGSVNGEARCTPTLLWGSTFTLGGFQSRIAFAKPQMYYSFTRLFFTEGERRWICSCSTAIQSLSKTFWQMYVICMATPGRIGITGCHISYSVNQQLEL